MTTGPTLTAEQIQGVVRRARAGDSVAFEQIVEYYKHRIYNYVLRMVGDHDTAEDIAQETFIRAHSSLAGFRGASSLQTWLYRIASNLAIDSMRRRKHRYSSYSLDEPVSTSDTEVSRDIEDEGPGPERQLLTRQVQQEVTEAIARLSPKLRTVVILYELQGMSYDEIAEIVGAPLGTIKSRLFNAREQLKDLLSSQIDIEAIG